MTERNRRYLINLIFTDIETNENELNWVNEGIGRYKEGFDNRKKYLEDQIKRKNKIMSDLIGVDKPQ